MKGSIENKSKINDNRPKIKLKKKVKFKRNTMHNRKSHKCHHNNVQKPLSAYGSFISTNTKKIAGAVAPNEKGGGIKFDGHSAFSSNGKLPIVYDANGDQTRITIRQNGAYFITWQVSPTPGVSAFGIFVESNRPLRTGPLRGSEAGTNVGGTPYQGQILEHLFAGDVLTLNNMTTEEVTLEPNVGNGIRTSSASLIIQLVSLTP